MEHSNPLHPKDLPLTLTTPSTLWYTNRVKSKQSGAHFESANLSWNHPCLGSLLIFRRFSFPSWYFSLLSSFENILMSKPRSNYIQVRITLEDKTLLKQVCRNLHIYVSSYVNLLVRADLAKYRSEQDDQNSPNNN